MKFEEIQDALAKGKTCYRDSDYEITYGSVETKHTDIHVFLEEYGITKDSEVDGMDKLADDWIIIGEGKE